jgi:hypothetical protein
MVDEIKLIAKHKVAVTIGCCITKRIDNQLKEVLLFPWKVAK